MTDNALDLLRRLRPIVAPPTSAAVELSRRLLLAEIAAGQGVRSRSARQRCGLAAAVLGVAAIAALTAAALLPGGGNAWAAALVKLASSSPRVLIDAPAWQLERADELSTTAGETTFGDGSNAVLLSWSSSNALASKLMRPDSGATSIDTAIVDGVPAKVFRYNGSNEFVAAWSRDGYSLAIRGKFADEGAFLAIATTAQTASVETWLRALPESVVQPDGRARVVAEMLTDVPLPPHFDAAPFTRGSEVRDRYQFGARVAGAIACGWLDTWFEARAVGDQAASAHAAAALASSRHWPVLEQMANQGDYPKIIWRYADAITGGAATGTKDLAAKDSYNDALGCPAQ